VASSAESAQQQTSSWQNQTMEISVPTVFKVEPKDKIRIKRERVKKLNYDRA